MPERRAAGRPRTLRVPDGTGGAGRPLRRRRDRPVAELRPEADLGRPADRRRRAAQGQRDRRRRGRAPPRRPASRSRLRPAPAPDDPARRRLRGRRPADRRQAGRPGRPSRRRATTRARWSTRCSARAGGAEYGGIAGVAAAGHRPSPRPRHERAADGRQARRRPGRADGPAQGAPGQEDLPGARPGLGRRPAVGRIEAPIGRDPRHADPDGRRPRRAAVDHRLPGPRAVRRLDAARARPDHRPDPPDPGPPRRDRPPGRRRPGLRHRARRGAGRTASSGCSCTPGGSSWRRRPTAT